MRTKEEIHEILSRRHRDLLQKLSSKEKMLEFIHEEALLSEFLTITEMDKGMLANDVYRGLQLSMNQQDDGSIELVWAAVDHGIIRRQVFENPSEGYIEFICFLSCSKGSLEFDTAKTARHGKPFKGLLERFFGK